MDLKDLIENWWKKTHVHLHDNINCTSTFYCRQMSQMDLCTFYKIYTEQLSSIELQANSGKLKIQCNSEQQTFRNRNLHLNL